MIDDTENNTLQEATDVETTEVPTEVTDAVEAAVAPASLSIQDLANLRNIIDVASQRGAFRTNEFTVVGATYTKLNNFIASVAPATEEERPEEVEAPDLETTTEE